MSTPIDEFNDAPPPTDDDCRGDGETDIVHGAVARITEIERAPLVAPGDADWPAPLAAEALHGLAGQIVQRLAPNTEADPAAILGQLLVGFGNVVGRAPHQVVEADRHGTSLFACLIGQTARGRKGTSFGHIKRLLSAVDDHWVKNCIKSGLSSGEGLISAVRDRVEKQTPVKRKGVIERYQAEMVDEGVSDKRLLAIEPEFASLLARMRREGNTISAQLRQAWDCGDLRVMTKSPLKATDAHVSVIGHITKQELARCLDSTEAANGFANRFLWVCVRRAGRLPDGGRFWDGDNRDLIDSLAEAVKHLRHGPGMFRRSDAAGQLWSELYRGELDADPPGLVGAVTARAEAQVMRLSLLYAGLDCARAIEPEHIRAAMAFWRYCLASARYVFGDRTGNPLADELLRLLRRASPRCMTRTQISNSLGRNKGSSQIGQALAALEGAGHASCRQGEPDGGAGRRPEVWFAVGTNERNENDEGRLR